MKSSFFPETPSRSIKIQVVYPGASPEEVEEGIILKMEDNLKGITGVERVTSVSKENNGEVTVNVIKGYDTDLVLQDVKNAIDRINSFPADMEPPIIFKRESQSLAISFALSGETDLRTLKTFARQVETDLLRFDGLSKTQLSGFPDEEIEIAFRESSLEAYQLTFQEAAAAVKASNIQITGGTIKGKREELLVRANNKGYFAKDLLDISIKSNPDGRDILLRDIADVRDKWSDNPNRSFMNQKPAVVITVFNTVEEDIIDIVDHVKEYIEKFNEKNEVVHADVIQDGTIALRQRIELLAKNGIIGFILVMIFLALFLQWRLAFWVAIAIPVSFLGMFVVTPFLGMSINVISLFGMIVVIGILVDDGIVISENIFQRFERGEEKLTAAVNGTMEVLPAVFSAIVTTVIAFSAFFFLDGRPGDIFPHMALVVVVTLLISLVEGAFILPAHVGHSKALSKDYKQNAFERTMNAIMAWMRDTLYAPVLRFCLNYKLLGLAIPVALLMISFGAVGAGIVKTTFFPFIERDNIGVNLKMPAGTREATTQQWLNHIEQAVLEVSQEIKEERDDGKYVVLAIEKGIGPTTYEGKLNVILLDGESRNMATLDIIKRITDKAGPIYGAESLSFGVQTPFGKPVSVSLLGSNLEELGQAVTEFKAELLALSELRDVVDNNQEGLREINISLKPKARLLGLKVSDITRQVRQGFFGEEVQRLQRGEDEVKIWMRYEEGERASIGQLERMRIRLPGGKEYPLEELAELNFQRGVIAINHLDGKREIRISADITGAKVSSTDIIADIQTNILPPILAKYPSVSYTLRGQVEETSKTQASGQRVGPVVFLSMIFVIVLTFRSFLQALMVIMLLPFGFIGVIWGHALHGFPISVLSVLGVVALIGVMVNDSLVFISAFNGYMKEGQRFLEAVYQAGLSRFRPILLTSVTTIAGLGPLILETSFQAQFLVPMAISIAYGLLAATFLTLITLPVLIASFNDIKFYMKWFWDAKKPSREELEPAISEMEALHEFNKSE